MQCGGGCTVLGVRLVRECVCVCAWCEVGEGVCVCVLGVRLVRLVRGGGCVYMQCGGSGQ